MFDSILTCRFFDTNRVDYHRYSQTHITHILFIGVWSRKMRKSDGLTTQQAWNAWAQGHTEVTDPSAGDLRASSSSSTPHSACPLRRHASPVPHCREPLEPVPCAAAPLQTTARGARWLAPSSHMPHAGKTRHRCFLSRRV